MSPTSSNNSGSGSESGFDADGRAILPSNNVAAKIYSRSAILSIKRHQPDLVVQLIDNAQELMIYPCFERKRPMIPLSAFVQGITLNHYLTESHCK